jgi:glucosamine--fructose-6-phosphate aminotransferase (isomerizing)
MEEMIALEPGLAARIVADPAAREVAALVRRALDRRQPISLVGSGTSEHAAMIVAELLTEGSANAAPGSMRSREAFEATLDPWPGLCIAVSHEGGTESTAEALAAARAAGAITVLITAAPNGTVAAAAQSLFVTPVVDRSWCHTVGYVSPLAAGAAIAASLAGEHLGPDGLASILEAALRDATTASQAIADVLGHSRRVVPVGSGVDHPAARELALKLEEGAALPAAARDTETLLHGHLAAIDESAALLFIVADPRAAERRSDRAGEGARAAGALGAPVAAILSAQAEARWNPAWTPVGRVVLPDAADRRADPDVAGSNDSRVGRLATAVLSTAISLQTLALATVHARGRNPDLIQREDPRHQAAADLAREPLPGRGAAA